MEKTLSLVTTKSGKEIHLGTPGQSNTVGHQLASARSRTFVDYYAKDVTCDICRATEAYAAWVAAR
jgi:hypothetical protein